MPHHFFFSYARANHANCDRTHPATGVRSNLLDTLFDDLVAHVHDNVAGDRSKIGYRDTNELKVGDRWGKDLAEAVSTASVLVAVFTPSYFESPACGRELRVFLDRTVAHRHDTDPNIGSPVIPLFWVDRSTFQGAAFDQITQSFSDIQYREAGMPTRYPTIGCKTLLDLHPLEYRSLVNVIATRIQAMAGWHLGPGRLDRDFHRLPPLFDRPAAVPLAAVTLDMPPAVPAEIAAGSSLPLLQTAA